MRIPTITIARTIGAASLLLIGYDALNTGASLGFAEAKNEESAMSADTFIKHQSSNTRSELLEKAKKGYREFLLDNEIIPLWFKTKNLFFSIGEKLLEYTIPIVLSLGALKFNNIFGKICACGLAVIGAKTLFGEILGKGKTKVIKEG